VTDTNKNRPPDVALPAANYHPQFGRFDADASLGIAMLTAETEDLRVPGTITVTNNGVASTAAQFVVVQSAMGLVVATDASYNYFSTSSSASPGQPIIPWGSGVGADTANDDRTYPMNQDNLANIPMTVYVGGIQASIAYRGRSQFPGVDQIVVTVPNNVTPGCTVSIVTVSGSIVSNSISIPVAQGGVACTDPSSAVGPAVGSLSGKNSISSGAVGIFHSTGITKATGTTVTNTASANCVRVSGLTGTVSSGLPSVGSCIILVALTSNFNRPGWMRARAASTAGERRRACRAFQIKRESTARRSP